MVYVLQRDDGKFVAPAGLKDSYTNKLQNARVFNTRAQADRECCENERVLTLREAFNS